MPIYDVARFDYFSRSGVKAASGVKAEVVKAKKPCSKLPHSKISQLARSIGVWWCMVINGTLEFSLF